MKKFFTVERYIFNEEKEDYEVVETKNIKIKWSSRLKCWLHNFIVFFPAFLFCLAVILIAPAVIFQSIICGIVIIGLVAKGMMFFYLWCYLDLTFCGYVKYQQEDFADWAQLNTEEEEKYEEYYRSKREKEKAAEESVINKLSNKTYEDLRGDLSEEEKEVINRWIRKLFELEVWKLM